MRGIENTLFKRWKGKAADRLKRPVSMVLAIVLVVVIINLVIITVVPQVTKTVGELGNKIPVFVDNVITQLNKLSKNYPQLQEQVAQLQKLEINWDKVVDSVGGFLKNGVVSVLSSTYNVASSIIGAVVNGVISFIFALYILSQKEKLASQGRRILSAYLPKRAENKSGHVLALLYRNFSNFITGQCLEAVILGTMFVISMTIFRMPYAVMVGVLIAFTALIPIIGAFIGCFVGAFLILINNPIQAVWFVVLFLVLQQIEGNLIYPKVVGNSVGLPSIWVLMAVSVGGSLFGIAGMLFFIPLMSTLYSLLRDSVNARNERRQLPGSYGGSSIRGGSPGHPGGSGKGLAGGEGTGQKEKSGSRKKNKGNSGQWKEDGKTQGNSGQWKEDGKNKGNSGQWEEDGKNKGNSGQWKEDGKTKGNNGQWQEDGKNKGNNAHCQEDGKAQDKKMKAGKAEAGKIEAGRRNYSRYKGGQPYDHKSASGQEETDSVNEEKAGKLQEKSQKKYRRKWQEASEERQESMEAGNTSLDDQ